MLIVESLKLNKFVETNIPRPIDLFQRLGFCTPSASSFTGETIVPSGTKIDNLALMDELDRQERLREDYASERSKARSADSASEVAKSD